MSENKIKICFLFGAGAEGKFQYDFPSGRIFKKDVINCNNVVSFSDKINTKTKKYSLSEGKLINAKQTSVFYQTLVENEEFRRKIVEEDKENGDVIEKYLFYKTKQADRNGNDSFYHKFKKAYRELIIEKLEKSDKNKDYVDLFLENAAIYSLVDKYFNFLRYPEKYKNECKKVMKLYYSAFLSVAKKYGIDETFIKKYNNRSVIDFRNTVAKQLKIKEVEIIEKGKNKEEKENFTYYEKIKEYKDSFDYTIVSSNYTKIAETIIGLSEKNVSHVHGRLDLFENLFTKEVKPLNEFNEEDIIFPYIMVQSGVKPIFSPVQINEFNKAINFLKDADYVFIIGYGINSDDEHITNILRDTKIKNLIVFVYSENDKEEEYKEQKQRIINIKVKDYIKFIKCKDLKDTLDCLKKRASVDHLYI